ncbi:dictomallein domain protein [Burkholderia pseudomallei]|nr:dictomallein domain protein [Burkholderia pseudomallei]
MRFGLPGDRRARPAGRATNDGKRRAPACAPARFIRLAAARGGCAGRVQPSFFEPRYQAHDIPPPRLKNRRRRLALRPDARRMRGRRFRQCTDRGRRRAVDARGGEPRRADGQHAGRHDRARAEQHVRRPALGRQDGIRADARGAERRPELDAAEREREPSPDQQARRTRAGRDRPGRRGAARSRSVEGRREARRARTEPAVRAAADRIRRPRVCERSMERRRARRVDGAGRVVQRVGVQLHVERRASARVRHRRRRATDDPAVLPVRRR